MTGSGIYCLNFADDKKISSMKSVEDALNCCDNGLEIHRNKCKTRPIMFDYA